MRPMPRPKAGTGMPPTAPPRDPRAAAPPGPMPARSGERPSSCHSRHGPLRGDSGDESRDALRTVPIERPTLLAGEGRTLLAVARPVHHVVHRLAQELVHVFREAYAAAFDDRAVVIRVVAGAAEAVFGAPGVRGESDSDHRRVDRRRVEARSE